jgi:hypothetical protein
VRALKAGLKARSQEFGGDGVRRKFTSRFDSEEQVKKTGS